MPQRMAATPRRLTESSDGPEQAPRAAISSAVVFTVIMRYCDRGTVSGQYTTVYPTYTHHDHRQTHFQRQPTQCHTHGGLLSYSCHPECCHVVILNTCVSCSPLVQLACSAEMSIKAETTNSRCPRQHSTAFDHSHASRDNDIRFGRGQRG